jgi:hypothetical protein
MDLLQFQLIFKKWVTKRSMIYDKFCNIFYIFFNLKYYKFNFKLIHEFRFPLFNKQSARIW